MTLTELKVVIDGLLATEEQRVHLMEGPDPCYTLGMWDPRMEEFFTDVDAENAVEGDCPEDAPRAVVFWPL